MPRKPNVDTNRNGAIGDFEAYAPQERSMDDLLEAAFRKTRGQQAPPTQRESTLVGRFGDCALVRYRFATDELEEDLKEMEGSVGWWHYDRQRATVSALFGVIREDGYPMAVIDVICDPDPAIHLVMLNKAVAPDRETMLQVLRHLDIPASWRAGAEHALAERFDAWRSDETGEWEIRAPILAVRVTMERVCFLTRPALRESVDIMVASDPAHDLASLDKEVVYWAKDYYRNAAFGGLHGLPQATVRPGYSSWMPKEDPVLVKVVGEGLERELVALLVPGDDLDAEATPEGTAPTP